MIIAYLIGQLIYQAIIKTGLQTITHNNNYLTAILDSVHIQVIACSQRRMNVSITRSENPIIQEIGLHAVITFQTVHTACHLVGHSLEDDRIITQALQLFFRNKFRLGKFRCLFLITLQALGFHLRDIKHRRNQRNGYPSRARAASAVGHFVPSAGSLNIAECRQWSTNEGNAPDQRIRSSVGINLVGLYGYDIKG